MSPVATEDATSAGGVVFRRQGIKVEIALILVGPKLRWQLPKGTVNPGEPIEDAALREVQEETGIVAELLDQVERIDYWFYASRQGHRIRFHKYVYFFLMRFLSGNVNDHDNEVEEARWVDINLAIGMLAFESEKDIVRKAHEMIEARNRKDTQAGSQPKRQEGKASA